jgi:predicted transposase/invertase (TIGR01784 family)
MLKTTIPDGGILEKNLKIQLTDVLDLVILELGKAKKLLKEGKLEASGHLEDWLKFFTTPYEVMEENKMDELDEKIKKAYEELQNLNEDEVERDNAERRYMNLMSIKGLKEREFNEGKKEGIKEGKIEGKKEGKTEEKIEIAKKMLESEFEVDQISNLTGLTQKEVNEIKNNLI